MKEVINDKNINMTFVTKSLNVATGAFQPRLISRTPTNHMFLYDAYFV